MEAEKMFSALGDETRLKIVRVLVGGERCACEIPAAVGKSQPNVSLHLKILRDAGVLGSRKKGKRVIYFIANRGILKLLSDAERLC
jgi:ArsR family transcriptional regulator